MNKSITLIAIISLTLAIIAKRGKACLLPLCIWLCFLNVSIACDASHTVSASSLPGQIRWIAYSPTHYDPDRGLFPSEADIQEDLETLRRYGFDGLVTYTSMGIIGEKLPLLAEKQGFKGLIVGVWNPFEAAEIENAIKAKSIGITKGYVVGNEGLYPKGKNPPRYGKCELVKQMNLIRENTGLPVTTSEDSAEYAKDPDLLTIGDWIFPNAHPYWAGYNEPGKAADWTRRFYNSQDGRKVVMLKEVGLPTIGGMYGQASELNQEVYYKDLANPTKGHINFVYFEAFDQPWKNQPPTEASWGLFRADRTPKRVIAHAGPNQPMNQ